MTPFAREILDSATAEVRHATRSLVGAVLDEQRRRADEPHRWALFHQRMAEQRRSRLVRAWHRGRAKRYAALAWAEDALASGCPARCCDLAALLGIRKP